MRALRERSIFAGANMAGRRPASAPSGLGNTGRALWRSIHGALPTDAEDAMEFDERELAILRQACRQADDIASLEGALKAAGVTVRGSKGQPRLNPIVTELRMARIALARLLGELDIPGGVAEQPATARSRRAQHAASVRWMDAGPSRRKANRGS